MYKLNEPSLTDFESFIEAFKGDYARPLMVGCSGGAGHNSAITAIIEFVQNKGYTKKEDFLPHAPVPLTQKASKSSQVKQIRFGSKLMHYKIGSVDASSLLRSFLMETKFPVLPDMDSLEKEITILNNSNQPEKIRFYIDMLIDVYPAGYESVAIWNVLQRQDKNEELKKLILLQEKSDFDNYDTVKQHFLYILKNELKEGKPRSAIISTQAMSLPALCDAVAEYNEIVKSHNEIHEKKAPLIKIHQYMTDLPTEGAVHFFNSLTKLDAAQRQQMILLGVDLKKEIVNKFRLNKPPFAGVVSISPESNPMIRPGFRDKNLKEKTNFANDEKVAIQVPKSDEFPKAEKNIDVKANERVAAIMLGSQAGDDTVEYVKILLETGVYDKIFVFGGTRENISKRIDNEIIANNAKAKDKIIRLENQDDKHMAPIMSRSNTVIIRGGGLSVMEQMAMPHNKDQLILVHHKESGKVELSSGISWEDKNVDNLLEYTHKKGIRSHKTSTQRAAKELENSYLYNKLIETYDISESLKERIKALLINADTQSKAEQLIYSIEILLKNNLLNEKVISNLEKDPNLPFAILSLASEDTIKDQSILDAETIDIIEPQIAELAKAGNSLAFFILVAKLSGKDEMINEKIENPAKALLTIYRDNKMHRTIFKAITNELFSQFHDKDFSELYNTIASSKVKKSVQEEIKKDFIQFQFDNIEKMHFPIFFDKISIDIKDKSEREKANLLLELMSFITKNNWETGTFAKEASVKMADSSYTKKFPSYMLDIIQKILPLAEGKKHNWNEVFDDVKDTLNSIISKLYDKLLHDPASKLFVVNFGERINDMSEKHKKLVEPEKREEVEMKEMKRKDYK